MESTLRVAVGCSVKVNSAWTASTRYPELLQASDGNNIVATGVYLATRSGWDINCGSLGCGNRRFFHLLEVEARLHPAKPRKQSGWLDQVDVLVKVLREAVGSCANQRITAGMLPYVVFLGAIV